MLLLLYYLNTSCSLNYMLETVRVQNDCAAPKAAKQPQSFSPPEPRGWVGKESLKQKMFRGGFQPNTAPREHISCSALQRLEGHFPHLENAAEITQAPAECKTRKKPEFVQNLWK